MLLLAIYLCVFWIGEDITRFLGGNWDNFECKGVDYFGKENMN
jgi:hypothetical protein